ncbi:MAG: MotA/TolQ/ExbB proton channel family protein [Rhodoferax sp.]|nr:MotA/TolQ/ExbB proton channel family protein [Rhodoferax sp.]
MPWLVTLWPAIVTVLGILYLYEDVAESARTMAHPILLIAILVGTVLSWSAIVLAQWRCMKEVDLAKRWSPSAHNALKAATAKSVFAPVYLLLSGHSNPPNRQQALQDEWASGESTLQGLLEFATFMGNALVGMGLVGTFVGLLGSLRDLSAVFNALIDGGGNSVSPTALFTDMITRLQLPMRAMGTAFIASLYGLLGSLVVALMMVGVRKSIARSAHVIHKLILSYSYEGSTDVAPHQSAAPKATTPPSATPDLLATDIAALKQDIATLHQARQQTQEHLRALHTEFQSLAAINLQHAEEIHPPLLQIGQAVQTLTRQLQTLQTQTRQDADNSSQQFSEALQALTRQLHSQQSEAQQVAEQSGQHFSQTLHMLTEQLQHQQTQARQEVNLSSQHLHQSLQTLAEQLQALHNQTHQEATRTSQNIGNALQTLAQQMQAQQAQALQTAQHGGQQLGQSLEMLTGQLHTLQTQAQQEAQHNSQHISAALETLARQLQAQQAQIRQEAQQEAQQYRQHLSQSMAAVGQLLALNNQGQLATQNELLINFQRLEALLKEQLAHSLSAQQNGQAGLNQILDSIDQASHAASQPPRS